MPDFDPYVAPPTEQPPPTAASGWGPWLGVTAAMLIILAVVLIGFRGNTQDPSLQFPSATPASIPQALDPTPS